MKLTSITAFLVLTFLAGTAGGAEFTDWLKIEKLASPINMYPPMYPSIADIGVEVPKDGRTLIFSSTRRAGTDRDLYLAQKVSKDIPWTSDASGAIFVQPITALNTDNNWESCPTLSLNEHELYFTSSRPDPNYCGAEDIWVSRRHDKSGYDRWEPAVHIDGDCTKQDSINTPSRELTPDFFEDESGRTIMYFASNRTGNMNIYQAELYEDGTFGPVTPVAELNSSVEEVAIAVRKDGLEVFLGSRLGHSSGTNNYISIWTATRESTSEPWSQPVEVASLHYLNTDPQERVYLMGRIALSTDGRELYFAHTTIAGNANGTDLYVATREKVKGKK